VDSLSPIQKRYHQILDSNEIEDIIKKGAIKASIASKDVLEKTKKNIGFVTF
jgi:tryptophanyl-tRNA synthetase